MIVFLGVLLAAIYSLFRTELRTDAGRDWQAKIMGDSSGTTGTSTGVTATSLTNTGASWTTDQWAGKAVFTGGVYGVVKSNTATVLTIDKWYAPGDPGGAAATTPGTGVYVIAAAPPAVWIGLTANSGAPAAGTTSLTGEITSGTLARALATYAHTGGTATYTLTKTWTSDQTVVIAKIGVFNAGPGTGGTIVFETLLNATASLVSGDQLQVTETVTL
jgi:hypothetical protein